MSASRDLTQAVGGVVYPRTPMMACDLCELPTMLPEGAIRDGQIHGLITCSACVEDALTARQSEMQP